MREIFTGKTAENIMQLKCVENHEFGTNASKMMSSLILRRSRSLAVTHSLGMEGVRDRERPGPWRECVTASDLDRLRIRLNDVMSSKIT